MELQPHRIPPGMRSLTSRLRGPCLHDWAPQEGSPPETQSRLCAPEVFAQCPADDLGDGNTLSGRPLCHFDPQCGFETDRFH